MFAVTKEDGMCMGMPDVCNTPAPPGPPIPLPYPNTALPMMADPATKIVLIAGMPALTVASIIKISNGDQAGVNGGVMSSEIMGQMEFTTSSKTVKLEGKFAVRLGDQTTHNRRNASGLVARPGQLKVRFLS